MSGVAKNLPRGYTAKVEPLFPEHYQPPVPVDLEFYELRLPEVRHTQSELERGYGTRFLLLPLLVP